MCDLLGLFHSLVKISLAGGALAAGFYTILAQRQRQRLADYRRRQEQGEISLGEERLATLELLRYRWLLWVMRVPLAFLLLPPVVALPAYYLMPVSLDLIVPAMIFFFDLGISVYFVLLLALFRDDIATADRFFALGVD